MDKLSFLFIIGLQFLAPCLLQNAKLLLVRELLFGRVVRAELIVCPTVFIAIHATTGITLNVKIYKFLISVLSRTTVSRTLVKSAFRRKSDCLTIMIVDYHV